MRKLFASTAIVALAAFMSDVCETVIVTVKGSSDPIRVNKADYDRDQSDDGEKRYTLNKAETKDQDTDMKMVGSPVTNEAATAIPPAPSAPNFGNPVAPSTPNEDTYTVASTGTGKAKRFFIVRATDGQPIKGFRDIDEKGYATQEEAWAAWMAVKKQPFEQQISPPAGMPEPAEIKPAD